MHRLHSVTLDEDACKGCTNCMKRCPTEAIRVRDGKAIIYEDRCVDCGECIRHCPYHAKKALTDTLAALEPFDFRVALPAPSLYGQFDEKYSIDEILSALGAIGFDDVFEVSQAAGLAAEGVREYLRSPSLDYPLISSSCPAVLRLLQVRFPSLIENLVPVLAPMEIAARLVRMKYSAKNYGKIGIFFISPCAGKMTDLYDPQGIEQSEVDGVIGIKDLYLVLKNALAGIKSGKIQARPNLQAPARLHSNGLSWGRVDGEGASIGVRKRVSVDGIEHVIKILEMVENGNLDSIEFIEAMACPAGCVGGPLTVENPFIARVRLLNREKSEAFAPVDAPRDGPPLEADSPLRWECPVKARQGLMLAPNREEALRLEEAMEDLTLELPGLDCGSCGAPSCRALAEDVVRNLANRELCTIKLHTGSRPASSVR